MPATHQSRRRWWIGSFTLVALVIGYLLVIPMIYWMSFKGSLGTRISGGDLPMSFPMIEKFAAPAHWLCRQSRQYHGYNGYWAEKIGDLNVVPWDDLPR